ncbi:MAG: GDSL-type esterase/lipase family protein [Elusimicrobiota bacterium]|nr:GDSL-type esterase/lipase family protein [Elusimicrobiota bacterium]
MTRRDALLVAASLAAGLGLAEAGLRLAGFRYAHHPVAMRYAASIAGAGVEPSLHARRFRVEYRLDRELLWRPVAAPGVTNSEGFLGPEWTGAKTKPRLVALGDSCTVAGETPYPERLRALLPGWEVWNAGVGSWSSYQGLRLLETRLLARRPDAVTVYFGWNDHWLSWSAPDKEFSADLDRRWRRAKALEASRVAQALLFARDRLSGPPGPRRGAPPRVSLEDYGENLRRIVAACRSAGARPLLLTAPSGLTPEHPVARALVEGSRNFDDAERLPAVHESYNAVVRAVAARSGATLVDLAADFDGARDAAELFTDGIHLSPRGHERAARLIAAAALKKP